ncbi:MAG: MipA/OmpV family protein [Lentisphaeria bacterium]|nr:MipA/OmpV family protein [Lentisphaeria bacterium]
MKTKISSLFGKALLFTGLLAGTVNAQEAAPAATTAEDDSRLSFGVYANYASKYIFRGQVLNDEAVLQGGADLGVDLGDAGSLTFSWWGNYVTSNNDGSQENRFNEYNWVVDYSVSLDAVDLSLGYIYYYFPGSTDETSEVYLGASFTAVETADYSLSVSGTFYYDVDEVEDYYATVGLGSEYSLNDTWTLESGVSVGYAGKDYNEFYFEDDSADWNDLTASIGLSAPIDDNTSFSTSLVYSTILGSDLNDATNDRDKDKVYLTIGVSYDF